MQQLKTITVKTSTKQDSVHMETLYAIINNCYNNLQVIEADCTSASYFINSANIFAQLQMLYASYADRVEYISLKKVMQVFANNITYIDEIDLYESVVENTALQTVKLQDYTYLSN